MITKLVDQYQSGSQDILYTTDLVVGDRVTHYKFGEGEIINVDSTTYSIPMVTVRLDVGEFAGEKIYRSADEWEKVI